MGLGNYIRDISSSIGAKVKDQPSQSLEQASMHNGSVEMRYSNDDPAIICGADGQVRWTSQAVSRLLAWRQESLAKQPSSLSGDMPKNLGDTHVSVDELQHLSTLDVPQCIAKNRSDGATIYVLQKVTALKADDRSRANESNASGFLVELRDVNDVVRGMGMPALQLATPQAPRLHNQATSSSLQRSSSDSWETTVENTDDFAADATSSKTATLARDSDEVYHSVVEKSDLVMHHITDAIFGSTGDEQNNVLVQTLCAALGQVSTSVHAAFVGRYITRTTSRADKGELITSLTPPVDYYSLISRRPSDDNVLPDSIIGFTGTAYVEGKGQIDLGIVPQLHRSFIHALHSTIPSIIPASELSVVPKSTSFCQPEDSICLIGLHDLVGHPIGGLGIAYRSSSINSADEDEDELIAIVKSVLNQLAPKVAKQITLTLEMLRLKKEKLETEVATKSKSHFLANMSHEIRTPVSAIIGLTDMILWDERNLSNDNRGRLELISSSGEHLLAVINGILDFSKIGDEDVKFQLKSQPLKLRKCIKEAVQLAALSPAASRKSIRIIAKHRELSAQQSGLIGSAPTSVSKSPTAAATNLVPPVRRTSSRSLDDEKDVKFHDTSLAFFWSVADDVPDWVIGDVTRIRQVMLNLMTNALKFTSQGFVSFNVRRLAKQPEGNPGAPPGSSSFAGEHHPLKPSASGSDAETRATLSPPTPPTTRRSSTSLCLADLKEDIDKGDAAVLLFTVQDSGCGIPKDKLNSLFKPYSQLDNPNNMDSTVGTGLGLAISSQLVEMMGGQIWVESSLSVGSKFSFCVPFPIGEPAASSSSGRSSPDEETEVEAQSPEPVKITPNKPAPTKLAARKAIPRPASAQRNPSASSLKGDESNARQMGGRSDDDSTSTDSEYSGLNNSQNVNATTADTSAYHEDMRSLMEKQHLVNSAASEDSLPSDAGSTPTTKIRRSATRRTRPSLADTERRNAANDMSKTYPLRILVAEDNAINQQIALTLLKNMGYSADLAKDGLEVLEKVKSMSTYDLILMDLSMPKMGGIEAMQELIKRWDEEEEQIRRQLESDQEEFGAVPPSPMSPPLANTSLPRSSSRASTMSGQEVQTGAFPRRPVVIALTASGTAADFEKCRDVGMQDWLNKPFRRLEMQSKIVLHFAHLKKAQTPLSPPEGPLGAPVRAHGRSVSQTSISNPLSIPYPIPKASASTSSLNLASPEGREAASSAEEISPSRAPTAMVSQ
ncbi:uncharacterized protein EV422DRAFT_55318 [Fimicolochytrium jonesii]|uniref:uncharacterized protein n=1 Tax=Fimicolochytrium jonesii TaxID=1396493 RepID=UPI0022FE7109|nr:uncharacterized protein EV422DRAFT_55318 [Fimicolochytrium jonesii]KAI8821137.1 hypothetical protein EV422DRAFT_55318 [Fimicolochytrium jonesii]